MTDFKIEFPKELPAENREELLHELEASAQVQTGAEGKKDASLTLFVIAATVQTIDILWNWYQALRAKNKTFDVTITTAKGRKIQLKNMTLDELRKMVS